MLVIASTSGVVIDLTAVVAALVVIAILLRDAWASDGLDCAAERFRGAAAACILAARPQTRGLRQAEHRGGAVLRL